MGFYLTWFSSFESRQVDHIFYLEEDSLFEFSFGYERKIDAINNEDYIDEIIKYTQSNNIDVFEIKIPENIDFNLEEALNKLSTFLEENDITVGLLIEDPRYIDINKAILDKYGLFYPSFEEIVFLIKKSANRHLFSSDSAAVNGSIKAKSTKSLIKGSAPKEEETSRIRKKVPNRKGLKMNKPFCDILTQYMNEKGKNSVEVYSKGEITRQVFSKIYCDHNIVPKKDTVICLAIGLGLNYEETIDLLASAGYALSRSYVSDTIIMDCLKKGIFDIYKINTELARRYCPTLGYTRKNGKFF